MFFEQGPIRPPSEADSLLLRFTRNCPWNRCDFCVTYKGETFSRRTLEEIKQDVDSVCRIVGEIRERSRQAGHGGEVDRQVLSDLYQTGNHRIIHVAYWLYLGGRTVFIQDANSLIMKTSDLVEALEYLRQRLPSVERITSYARSQTLARKSPQEMEEIRGAGLCRIHVGMESGSDAVLKYMNKGATARDHVEGGRRAVEAGISLCTYVLLGLGGRNWPEEHYLETARVLNLINPDFIRMRTLAVVEGTPLHDKLAGGEFREQSEDEIVAGERLLIENLEGVNSQVVSDHMLNLLEEVRGKLPEDREKMLAVIDGYLSLPEELRLNFRLGKRAGLYRGPADLNDPARRGRVEAAVRRLQAEGRLDGTLSSLKASMI